MGYYQTTTVRGYKLSEAASALQKAIRRGDARLAGYFAVEMFESGYAAYVWRRLLTISAEDVWGLITQEVFALYSAWKVATKGDAKKGRIFVAKATILLCQARKCRDADHLTNLVYDVDNVDHEAIDAMLAEVRRETLEVPEYAYDVHTSKGRRAGKTKAEFFVTEFDALELRQMGLFDHDVTHSKR